jgi:hypothetical protein
LVGHEIHDVTFAFHADEFEGQERADGLLSGDEGGTGQMGLAHHFGEAQIAQEGDEDEESAQARAKGSRRQVEGTHVGAGGDLGSGDGRSFVVASSGQAGEAFFVEDQGDGMNAGGVLAVSQFALNVVDGKLRFAQRDDQFPALIAEGRVVRPSAQDLEETLAKIGVVTEAVTEDPKGAWRIAKVLGDLGRGTSLGEVSSACLVLALLGALGGGEELRGLEIC